MLRSSCVLLAVLPAVVAQTDPYWSDDSDATFTLREGDPWTSARDFECFDDDLNSQVSYSWSGLPLSNETGLTFPQNPGANNPIEISGTPNMMDSARSPMNVALFCTDGVSRISVSIRITVLPVNQAPTVNAILPDSTIDEGKSQKWSL